MASLSPYASSFLEASNALLANPEGLAGDQQSGTKIDYIKRVNSFVKKADASWSRADGGDWDQWLTHVIDWMIGQKPTWSRATWELYTASIRFWLGLFKTHSDEYWRGWAKKGLSILETRKRPASNKHPTKTSGQRLKTIKLEDMGQILSWGHNTRAEDWHIVKCLWLATLLTGLRPIEWWGAGLDENQCLTLSVSNAKLNDNRAGSPSRFLDLAHLPAESANVIYAILAHANLSVSRELWTRERRRLSRLFRSMQKDHWPQRKQTYCIYTARHQFAAEAKAFLSREEVAVLMGHASIKTAAHHYGRRRSSWRRKHTDKPVLEIAKPCQEKPSAEKEGVLDASRGDTPQKTNIPTNR